jgi:coiled-coil domain-containing protein 22
MERGYLARRACLDMLPEAPAHLARLASEIEEHTATLLALSQEWDGVRLPLIAAINEHVVQIEAQEAEFVARSAAAQALQADMATLLAEGRAKQQQLQALQGEWESVQAGLASDGAAPHTAAAGPSAASSSAIAAISRTTYSRRVMDIVRSIRKQKAEIGKIVRDVRSVQQDIQGISERLGRTSKSAMVTFEKAAVEQQQQGSKGDATSLQVLRQAVTLQEAFQRLIAVNSAIGNTDNEIRDLEGRIDSMQQRNDARNMAALRGDLEAFAAENRRMEEQLAALGAVVPPAAGSSS